MENKIDSTKSQTFLVIGASAASIGALRKLRSLNPQASITCVTAEKEMPYNRCLLADYLAQSRPDEAVYTKGADFFEENNINLILNTRIASIDTNSNLALAEDGKKFTYEKLFLGIGKSAFIPPIPGAEAQGVLPFFDLKDAHAIRELAQKPNINNVIVVGGGLTGLECADALTEYDLFITVIEQADHVLPAQIDVTGAQYIQTLAEGAGIAVHTSSSIGQIHANNNNQVTGVTLTDGTTLPADAVILATGGRPNIKLAQQAGLEVNGQGLVVTKHMQTSNPSIYAGGDICWVDDLLTNNKMQSCLWPDAVMQGMVAASNMCDKQREYPGTLAVTSSTIFDTTFVTCGPVTQAHKYKALVKKENNFYHRLLIDEQGILQGFVMVGNITGVGQLRKAMLEKRSIYENKNESSHPTAP